MEVEDEKRFSIAINPGNSNKLATFGSEKVCYWEIGSPLVDNYYIEGESEMTIQIDKVLNTEIYVY